ncbi:MAG: hypothetical protein HY710_01310 [Candidatus Latescibacteria bacterium]|nr:hypothetical protein [Candidatus Latescibacterota bacterium]
MRERLQAIFGHHPDLIEERQTVYTTLLDVFAQTYGRQERVALVRAPARLNLKGVHVDHRGGYVNYLTIDREIAMAVSPREDDTVVLHDLESDRFGPRAFRIGDDLPAGARGRWLSYIEQVRPVPGDWANYVKAAVLRLQDHYADRPLRGMNLLVAGNIPLAAGLSSSSALVVAACEGCLWVNGLTLSNEQKALLCGEGEWYIGTRGGAGDHAAMIFGRRDHLIRLRFFPLTVEPVAFPSGYRVVVCNSLRQAHKADGAKSTFNERVATYEIGMLLLRQAFPDLAGRLTHLRDINAEQLGLDEADVYRMVAALPERVTRADLLQRLPAHRETLERLFNTHREPLDGYRVRAVCLFGLAECERSRMYADVLTRGEMETVGRLMELSHDGDRVVTFDGNGRPRPWGHPVTDAYLRSLVADAQSRDPVRTQRARLWQQAGGYGCSCEELDQLVDIAKTVPGVVGAGLTGAGLGGCVLALVQDGFTDALIEAVTARYYAPRGLSPSAMVCTSVEGAGRVF